MSFYINKRLVKKFYIIVVFLPLALAVGFWYQTLWSPEPEMAIVETRITEVGGVNEPIQAIPLIVELDRKKVTLGNQLFHEAQLSHTNTISCATCHNLNNGGVDKLVRSIGINGVISDLNAPTVFNSGFNFKQDWNGAFETLEDHVDGAIKNPHRMASNWSEVIDKLKRSPFYLKAFGQIYEGEITDKNIEDAIATFERSLITPNSRFDKFLRGDSHAINAAEKEGYRLFKNYGCVSCHQGVNVGGNLFQKFGIMGDYFSDRGNVKTADFGRFNVTGNEEDRYVFKVPSLRNITLTAPYFHDGSAQTLAEAIAIMGKYQLGRDLSPKTIDLLIKFLRTLTGEYQGKPL